MKKIVRENIQFKRGIDPKEAMDIERPKVTFQNKENIEFKYKGLTFQLIYNAIGKYEEPKLWDLFHEKNQYDMFFIMSFHNDYHIPDLIEVVKDEIEKYVKRNEIS